MAEAGWGDGAPRVRLLSEPGRPDPAVASCEQGMLLFDGVLHDRESLVRATGEPAGLNDAELVLRAYLRMDDAVWSSLRGRYSIVVWDPARSVLLAVRDHLGVRPLFYAQAERRVLVSPFVDRLLREPDIGPEVDPLIAAGFILGLPPSTEATPFVAVRRVPSGHLLEFRSGTRRLRRYWEPTASRAGGDDHRERFGSLLQQAVRRCGGGERVGVLLSGGLDSATVAAAAGQLSKQRGIPPPCALSIFDPTPESEEAMQRAVAVGLGLPLIGTRPDDAAPPGQLLAAALALAPSTAWPPGPLAPVLDLLASRAADSGCHTLLTGDGGDEWLVPLPSWTADRLLRLDLPGFVRLWQAGRVSWPNLRRRERLRGVVWTSGVRPLVRSVGAGTLSRWAPGLLRRARYKRITSPMPTWLLPDPGLRRDFADWWIEQTPESPLRTRYETDRRSQLTATQVSMLMEDAFTTGRRLGSEILSPFWDPDLVAFLLALDPDRLLEGGVPKALARDYLTPLLPFARGWPPKAFGDALIEHLMAREGSFAWAELGGTQTLAALGVVDEGQLSAAMSTHRPGLRVDRAGEVWEAMSLEAWLTRHTGSILTS